MDWLIFVIFGIGGSGFLLGSLLYGMYQIGAAGEKNGEKKLRWWILALYMAASIGLSLLGNSFVNLFALAAAPWAVRWACGTDRGYLMHAYLLAVAVFLTDYAVNVIVGLGLAQGLPFLQNPQLQYILLAAIVRLTEYMVIRLMVLLIRQHSGEPLLRKQIAVSFILPFFSLINVYTMVFLVQIIPNFSFIGLVLLNVALLIGLNIFVSTLLDAAARNFRLENERKLLKEQEESRRQYYEQEQERYEESRKLIHDIRNHVIAMEELYRGQQSADALKYAEHIHQVLNDLGQKYYTDYKLLNMILNDKVRIMQREGIRADIRIGEAELDFLQDMDVTCIFANLLDNAIAAAGGCRDAFIRLRVNPVRQFISVTMENSCEQEPLSDGRGRYLSRKEGHEGRGLTNIQRTVERYGGDMQCSWEKGIFTTRLMLVQSTQGG